MVHAVKQINGRGEKGKKKKLSSAYLYF